MPKMYRYGWSVSVRRATPGTGDDLGRDAAQQRRSALARAVAIWGIGAGVSRRGLDGLDDEALMRRVERGDVDALAVLHGRYARLVRSIARRIVTDPRAAEEVTQDVFWDVWRVPERFDPSRGPFVAWLRVVARYRAITLWRADRGGTRGRTFLLPEFDNGPDDGLDRLAPLGPGADEAVLAAVVAGIVHEALAELPAAHREVLVLAYWGGLSVREIAALLDVPEGTVKTRTWDARERLRRLLGPLGHGLR